MTEPTEAAAPSEPTEASAPTEPTEPAEPAEPTEAAEPKAVARCPWCSAELPEAQSPTCPACGAALASAPAGMGIPGVTEVDPVLRAYEARSASKKPKRNGLLGMLLGQGQPGASSEPARVELPPLTATEAQAIHPPSDDVRKAMLEMELEAVRARLSAAPAEPVEPAVEQAAKSEEPAVEQPAEPAVEQPAEPAVEQPAETSSADTAPADGTPE